MAIRYERFTIPILGKNTIRRKDITERIEHLSKRGILFIHSPAGYGKTTAVALWAKDKRAAAALPLFRSRVPKSAALIIISRNPPPDSLIGYVLKGGIQQISDLQFSHTEIMKLFKKNKLPLTNYEAESIRRQTDGWAAALAAKAGREHLPVSRPAKGIFTDGTGTGRVRRYGRVIQKSRPFF